MFMCAYVYDVVLCENIAEQCGFLPLAGWISLQNMGYVNFLSLAICFLSDVLLNQQLC